MNVRIADIKFGSVVDGPGVRTAVWFAGCPIRCPGCYNSHLWPADSGQETSLEVVLGAIRHGRQVGDQGVTLVGGEPLAQPRAAAALCLALRMLRIHTIVYTGFCLENIIDAAQVIPAYWTILTSADVLVDGPFIQEEADPRCQYRGSRNQRVIDLRQTFDVRRVLQRAPIVTLDQEWDDQHLVSVAPDGMVHFSVALWRMGLALGGRVRPARNCGETPAPAKDSASIPAHAGGSASIPAHAGKGGAMPTYGGEEKADG
jgi:anaerobic ribonucleoside-triphosphate reductase activating protein